MMKASAIIVSVKIPCTTTGYALPTKGKPL
jgi:hypothetical protein